MDESDRADQIRKEAGITYRGTLLRQTQVNEPGTIVASKQSAPLHDLLKIMLKK
ncbi:D-alanyl-D-alanine carboxypeptidase, partial [Salmonella enterica subsp. enterica serovar Kentucky]|nr:D-alanyl-D-alanine carboxypeptidase [Salmonella enterica subsp. enterica serovar Kentucky]